MGQVRTAVERAQQAWADRPGGLMARIRALEAEVQECRQLNLRLAEVLDVVGELLLPLPERDEARVAEALERYRRSVGGPLA